MKILPYKWVRVSEGLHVWMSNHYHYSDFGIRDDKESRYGGRRYIMGSTPGTGFFERESESHSYHEFVRKALFRQRHTYWGMLTGREPDFDREIAVANKALLNCEKGLKRQLLDSYVSALIVARREEHMERSIRAIKDKMGHHSNKFMVSVMSHYKNRIRQSEHDMRAAVWHVKDHYSPEVYEAYIQMVDAFTRVASCRRVWQYTPERRNRFNQVFFDLGVFDYIRSESYLPLIRDCDGVHYYLLPDSLIVARGSVDFDIVPLKTLTIVSQELAIEEPTGDLLSYMGDAASMIKIPEFGLNFYFNHVRSIVEFTGALDRLKALL